MTSPIFIHSLFRSGSTYLFNVFRRSSEGYYCYQEPLHEIAVYARNEPKHLLVDHGEEKVCLLRHPKIGRKYFQELYDTWPAWKDALTESAVYDGYFAAQDKDIGISYWSALSHSAKGRPVFQECRTAGRIEAIKEQLGGYHLYLWRNPWDQWWSYKVSRYFDSVNQLIINATSPPPAVQLLHTALGFEAYGENDLGGAFAYYDAKPLTSEESYLVFYMLWCLGLRAGMKYAHQMINIDQLHSSSSYREATCLQLTAVGITDIDFSDCQITQGLYLENDVAFFSELEARVHHWLKEGGWSKEEIKQVQAIRQQSQPSSWNKPIEALNAQEMAEQASRTRALARRFETSVAWNVRKSAANLATVEAHAIESKLRATEAEARANQAETRATQAETMLNAIYKSRTWQVTAPLRALARFVRRNNG